MQLLIANACYLLLLFDCLLTVVSFNEFNHCGISAFVYCDIPYSSFVIGSILTCGLLAESHTTKFTECEIKIQSFIFSSDL